MVIFCFCWFGINEKLPINKTDGQYSLHCFCFVNDSATSVKAISRISKLVLPHYRRLPQTCSKIWLIPDILAKKIKRGRERFLIFELFLAKERKLLWQSKQRGWFENLWPANFLLCFIQNKTNHLWWLKPSNSSWNRPNVFSLVLVVKRPEMGYSCSTAL